MTVQQAKWLIRWTRLQFGNQDQIEAIRVLKAAGIQLSVKECWQPPKEELNERDSRVETAG